MLETIRQLAGPTVKVMGPQPFDVLRFYISQASLDEMAYSEGNGRARSLVSSKLGAQDSTMHGLAVALLDRIELGHERSTLFVDHIALAFYARTVSVSYRPKRDESARR